MRTFWSLVIVQACSRDPWSVAGAPNVPPDQEFRAEEEDVWIWECFDGSRVLVRQARSGCGRAPVLVKGACGKALPLEGTYSSPARWRDGRHWPGVSSAGLPLAPRTDAPLVGATFAANAALERDGKKEGLSRMPRVTENEAHVSGDATIGWTIVWQHTPPGAGTGWDVLVTANASGAIDVRRTNLTFSAE